MKKSGKGSHIRSKFSVFVNPVVEDTKWADDEEWLRVVVLSEVCTKCDRLEGLPETHLVR